jgi:hypothetical protein
MEAVQVAHGVPRSLIDAGDEFLLDMPRRSVCHLYEFCRLCKLGKDCPDKARQDRCARRSRRSREAIEDGKL